MILKGEEGREIKRETQCERETLLPSICTPTMGGTHNLDICTKWESNPQHFGVQGDTPTS